MKIHLFALMLLIGIVLALHLTMNAQVGIILKNPKMGNALFWIIGGVTAVIIGLTSWETEVFNRIKDVPIWLLTAGAMGGLLVFGIAFGMSVDDTLRFLAQYRLELSRNDWKIKKSVFATFDDAGISMFYTSIILFFGFSVFMLSRNRRTK